MDAAERGWWAAHRAKLKEIIDATGWAVTGVFPTTADGVWLAYTIGMTGHGLPELVLSGIPGRQAQDLLNTAAERHLAAEFTPGDAAQGIADVEFRVITAPRAPIGQTRLVYGPNVHAHALQLVWPDDNGQYPGLFYSGKYRQELFGPPWW